MSHQRPFECLLYALCSAHGVDYPTASDLYALEHGHAWGSCSALHDETTWNSWTDFQARYFPTVYRIGPLVGNAVTVPATGKHIVIIVMPDRGMAHALFLNDGLMEDPMDGEIMPAAEMLTKRYADWTVKDVTAIEEVTK